MRRPWGGQWRAVLASAGALTPAPAKPAPSWSLTSRLTGVPGWLCVTRGPGPDRTSGLLPLPVASVARKRLRRDLMIAAPLRRAQGQERPGPDPIAPLPVGRCRRLHTAYRRPGEAARGSQSRPGRTSGRSPPWAHGPRRRDGRAAKEDRAEPDGPSVERRRALAGSGRGAPEPMTSIQQRQRERRQQKLEQIRGQVVDGSLVIRQMTAEERKRYPARRRDRRRP